MKKIIALLLALAMVIAMAAPVSAYGYMEQFSAFTSVLGLTMEETEVELVKNGYNSNGERHIKVDWEDVSGADQYQLQISTDPRSRDCATVKRLPRQGTYYNFVLGEDVDATYYVRVRPVFIVGSYDGRYVTVEGRWSDTVMVSRPE